MGDPLAAARHVHQALKPDGTWLVVEPAASDDTVGNMNPVGRVYYGFSTLLCVPNALSQSDGYALGAQASEAAIRQIVTDEGSPDSAGWPKHPSTWSTRSGRGTAREAAALTIKVASQRGYRLTGGLREGVEPPCL
jgi:hypothetical protein